MTEKRIFYGIMGDARGHLSRSLAVARELEGCTFLFAGGGVTAELREYGYHVHDLKMLSTQFRGDRVDLYATFTNGSRMIFGRTSMVRALARVIEEFDPDLIISDYEYLTPAAAKTLGRECISLDHQHVITHARYAVPPGQRMSRYMTTLPISCFFSGCSRYFIVSFFDAVPKDARRVEVFPPILGKDVQDMQSLRGNDHEHVLMYMSMPGSLPGMEELAAELDRRVYIYGTGREEELGNRVYKPKSRQEFLKDLATCSYVVSNGGHSLISEALYFGKPVLSFPIRYSYEQYLNGHFLTTLRYGKSVVPQEAKYFGKQGVLRFEDESREYAARIRERDFRGNERIAQRLRQLMRT